MEKLNKMDNKSFISLEETKQNKLNKKMAYKVSINNKNVLIGSLFVLVGAVTLPIPCGSIFIILFGVYVIFCPLRFSLIMREIKENVKFWWGCLW